MSYARLATRLYNTPLLLSADKLDVLHRVLIAHEDGRAKLLAPYEAKERIEVAGPGQMQRTQSGYLRTADGIAIVGAVGTMVQRTGGMDAESGLVSYNEIERQVSAAMNDPQVRGLLLEVDSNGGEVSGNFDLAALIHAAGQVKPIFAHANEMALSGGYSVLAAAEESYAPRTGLIGSIGARMRHVDQSQYDARRGMVYTDIVSGDRKNALSPNAPLSEEDRAWAQDHVDHAGGIFIEQVAKMRGLNAQDVKDMQAEIFHTDRAIDLGLIDGIATIGDTLQMLRTRINAPGSVTRTMRAAAKAESASTGDSDMGQETPKMYSQAELDTAKATAKSEAKTEIEQAAATQAKADAEAKMKMDADMAVKAEQARIAGIIGNSEAQGRTQLAQHLAFKTTSSVDDAVALLAAAPKEMAKPANQLAAAMKDVPNPKVGAGAESDVAEADSLAARIMNAGKRAALKVAK